MYYRYEARHVSRTDAGWKGIFQCMDPSQRRKWYHLAIPKWYGKNPGIDSRAWFTEHGHEAYGDLMLATMAELEQRNYETRVLTAETLDNMVVKGKTQVIQTI